MVIGKGAGVVTTGAHNTAIGNDAGTTGAYNVAIGHSAVICRGL